MDDIKKVSELARAGEVSNGDILLISKRTSTSTLKSLGLDYANLVKSLRKSFKDEIDTLNTISDTYVDDTTMKFTYDTDRHDLVLKTDYGERRVNISKFIFTGMVKNVVYKKASHALAITFNKADGSTVTVDVDISDVFIFNEGEGIDISEDKTISIDPDVVSKVGHKHVLADITDYTAPEIPTKVSQLENDKGFITGYTETDPTVPAWAKAETKPTYTASEVGALASTVTHLPGDVPVTRKINSKEMGADITLTASDVGALASTTTHLPGDVPTTRKVNGKSLSEDITLSASDINALPGSTTHLSGDVPTSRKVNGKALSSDVTLAASDVGAYAKDDVYNKTEVDGKIPTKVSQLDNDSGFITGYTETDPTVPAWAKAESKPTYTAADVGAYAKTETYSKSEVDGKVPTKTSQLANDSGFLTAHQSLDGCVKTSEKVSITLENEAGEKVTYELYGKVVS